VLFDASGDLFHPFWWSVMRLMFDLVDVIVVGGFGS
jgi:hypothetical protein